MPTDAHYGTGTLRGDDMYGHGGFIVHFFDRALIDRLATGVAVAGALPDAGAPGLRRALGLALVLVGGTVPAVARSPSARSRQL